MGLLADMAVSSAQRSRDAQARTSESVLRAHCATLRPVPRPMLLADGFDVIAELKLRSPSLGDLSAQTLDPVARLAGYARGGAVICSVLTEPSRFDGRLDHLRVAAEALAPHGVPAMRKDFLVDPYQVLEARAHGAGGVLLIVRLVERPRLVAMLDEAAAQGLFVLLEAFDADDLGIASDLARERRGRHEQVLIGLNCRDLETLEIDFGRFQRLRDRLPSEWPAVAESGVTDGADAACVAALGYRLALVGTSLMRNADPAEAVRSLLQAGRGAAAR
ncbi:MAG TPA: indole-3-glycerol phosphate synthase TrpC [Steroidobacteraceae bacterium]|nr:indole-3-glycerol phosphate synthase TrpC [Steroidobacteraceae bacterium]